MKKNSRNEIIIGNDAIQIICFIKDWQLEVKTEEPGFKVIVAKVGE